MLQKIKDNEKAIYNFKGKKIYLPENKNLWRDMLFMSKNREIHGFE